MQHNNLLAEAVTQWEAVEDLREELEGLYAVFRLDLALKAIDPIHIERLVVAARQMHVVRVQHLEREEE